MDLDKTTLVNIVLLIHMALTGMALLRLFKLKNATGGLVIISLLAMMIPILGPSGLIVYLNKKYEQQQKEEAKKNAKPFKSSKKQK